MWAGEATGWLGKLGFYDFAGSLVVHGLGGGVALAAIIVLDPRLGRFGNDGHPIQGNSVTAASGGILLLYVGWFGFTGGATLGLTETVSTVFLNTLLGGLAGGLVTGWYAFFRVGVTATKPALSGILAGLVAVTSSANVLSPLPALIVGAIGGFIGLLAFWALQRLELDDRVGAVPVHLFPGVWGVLAVALFVDPAAFGSDLSRLGQLGVQALAVVTCLAVGFLATLVFLYLLNKVYPIRVSVEDERQGLDITEHGVTTEWMELLDRMAVQQEEGSFEPIDVDAHSEVGEIAEWYNRVLGRVRTEIGKEQAISASLSFVATHDSLTGLLDRQAWISPRQINDNEGHQAGDAVLREVASRVKGQLRVEDDACRYGGDEFCVLAGEIANRESMRIVAERMLERLRQPIPFEGRDLHITMSIGVICFPDDAPDTKSALALPDQLMFKAKELGRDRVIMAE